ncbi:30S ribosomal protein S13 [Candidatus Pacearchaeota archaeon]|nr:30S ribosomal protein S13 [Candidatus Pacearchaeota archaeon]
MAEEKKQEIKEVKKEKPIVKHEEKEKKHHAHHDERKELSAAQSIVRIVGTDIPGEKDIFSGLTRIKGISWSMSNAVCKSLNLDKNKQIKDLSEIDIEKITTFLKKPNVPSFLLNRKNDRETGLGEHLITTDLEIKRDFDIRRHKKIRTYKGLRHALGLPVRGQRTRSHFRKGRAIGVQKSKSAAPAAKAKK